MSEVEKKRREKYLEATKKHAEFVIWANSRPPEERNIMDDMWEMLKLAQEKKKYENEEEEKARYERITLAYGGKVRSERYIKWKYRIMTPIMRLLIKLGIRQNGDNQYWPPF
jgi:hypothetical protein